MVHLGEFFGRFSLVRFVSRSLFGAPDPMLHHTVTGVDFASPFGLAAGFDYEARLTQILPAIGFGFGTVGTLTNMPYEGNTKPRLGRLPKSRSLMVNKGFKNLSVAVTLDRLKGLSFAYPVGVSIGKTNVESLATQKDAIEDVLQGFRCAEDSAVPFAYYELNISCPNLKGGVEFYTPAHLEDLLTAVSTLHLSRPVWVKMPIAKTDEEITAMLDVIVRFPAISAVVFGNLQRDRNHPTLDQAEVAKFSKGNFSGLPCRDRSDELVALAYRGYGTKLCIIGCGGVVNVDDAYRKMTLGASLVELISGLIFEGPQIVAQMNLELAERLRADGHASVADAVGSAHR